MLEGEGDMFQNKKVPKEHQDVEASSPGIQTLQPEDDTFPNLRSHNPNAQG
jgi:hypothetical protein